MRRTLSTLLFTLLSTQATASKRGLANLGDTHSSDLNLLLSPNSSLSWYYTWSTTPIASLSAHLPFLPMLHSLDDASSSTASLLSTLPDSSTHLLAFNEPDGPTSSGGSAITPAAAAQAYVEYIHPLRDRWNISHPVITSGGIAWLRAFNASCWALAPATGCIADFVAVHWYGDFVGLEGWLGTLEEFYASGSAVGSSSGQIEFWVTEMALPQGSEKETVAMLNASMGYLDGRDDVAGYAWFGTARKSGSWDGYTGGNVAVFKGNGALTDVGALYLGGKEEGFKAGMTGAGSRTMMGVVDGAVLMVAMVGCLVVNNNLW